MKYFICIIFLLVVALAFSQRSHLVFESTFETNSLASWDSVSKCGNTITFSDSIKRFGLSSARFDLNAGDTDLCGNLRTQLMKNSGPAEHSAWYGFSVYFADYPSAYDGVESFFQVYRDSGDFMPPLSLNYYGHATGSGPRPAGRYITIVQSLVSPESTRAGSPYTVYYVPLDTITMNKWIDIVMNVKWSNDTSGYIRVWMNDKLVFINSGENNYTPNYMRLGPDKEDWRKNWKVSSTGHRRVYFDEVRVGDSSAAYLDVKPGSIIPPLAISDPRPSRPGKPDATPFNVVNPVRGGVVQVQIPSRIPRRLSYEIINVNGVVLVRGNLSILAGSNYREINVKHLASGMYFLCLQSSDGLTIKSIIK